MLCASGVRMVEKGPGFRCQCDTPWLQRGQQQMSWAMVGLLVHLEIRFEPGTVSSNAQCLEVTCIHARQALVAVPVQVQL